MFTIGEIAERTGVPEGTLRMWERRHGFPTPERLPSGHRRYSDHEAELVRRVAYGRAAGLTLPVAIERARQAAGDTPHSLFAGLRRARPELMPQLLAKPLVLALTHAIEDESLSRAERPLLFGAFQRRRFYRQSEARWREFARQAELSIVFADFERLRTPRAGPAELPVDRDHPLSREWAVVCDAPGYAVCLAAWEPPASQRRSDAARSFEVLWSVEQDVVREASRICARIAAARAPELLEPARGRIEAEPDQTAREQLRLATAITSRMLASLSGAAARGSA